MTPLWLYYCMCAFAWLLHFAWIALSTTISIHEATGQSSEPVKRPNSRILKGGLFVLTLAVLAYIGVAIFESIEQFPETTLLRERAMAVHRGIGVVVSVWMCLGLFMFLLSTRTAVRRQRSLSSIGLATSSLSKRVARSVRWFIVLSSIIAVVTAAVWFFPVVTKPRNPFAKLPPPVRLSFVASGPLAGAGDGLQIDEGPERAAAFQALLAEATWPGKNKCQWLGEVTLYYASGETRTVGLGCCTVWIDNTSWHLGDSDGKQFFARPTEPAAR